MPEGLYDPIGADRPPVRARRHWRLGVAAGLGALTVCAWVFLTRFTSDRGEPVATAGIDRRPVETAPAPKPPDPPAPPSPASGDAASVAAGEVVDVENGVKVIRVSPGGVGPARRVLKIPNDPRSMPAAGPGAVGPQSTP